MSNKRGVALALVVLLPGAGLVFVVFACNVSDWSVVVHLNADDRFPPGPGRKVGPNNNAARLEREEAERLKKEEQEKNKAAAE